MRARFVQILVLLALTASCRCPGAPVGWAEQNYFDQLNLSESSEGHYTMKDRRDKRTVLRTARILHRGDEFIDQENRHFKVVAVEQKIAWAEELEAERSSGGGGFGFSYPAGKVSTGDKDKDQSRIGIYHTHGAESYVPSDGTDTIDEGGGILEVGESFTRALEEKGFEVNHIREPHTPHDAGAYQRSRRTAEELLTEGDQIIFDVHRDAVPPEEYEKKVDGEEVTRILLVVGQQNQNADSNRDFAATLKKIADKQHPGLIKGILGAQGNYNQDLTPRAILLEVGAHENNREDAERAVALFADAVDTYASGTAPSKEHQARANRLSLGSVLKVLLLLVAALFAYLLISTGSWTEMKKKVTGFFKDEFADVLQIRSGGRDKGSRDKGD